MYRPPPSICTVNCSYSIMGANIKLFYDKYCMDKRNVYATWRDMCEKNEDVIRVCMQVKELVDMMDKYVNGVLNRGECSEIIESLCTE